MTQVRILRRLLEDNPWLYPFAGLAGVVATFAIGGMEWGVGGAFLFCIITIAALANSLRKINSELDRAKIELKATESKPFGPEHHRESIRVIRTHDELATELLSIVNDAERWLVCTGSRSREQNYLEAIENRLRSLPSLVHYRVLYGPPHNELFKRHLTQLLSIRDPADRVYGLQTLYIGMFNNSMLEPEKFVSANEKRALVVFPSLTGVGRFDTALVLSDPQDVDSLIRYVQELYRCSQIVESPSEVAQLPVLRQSPTSPGVVSAPNE